MPRAASARGLLSGAKLSFVTSYLIGMFGAIGGGSSMAIAQDRAVSVSVASATSSFSPNILGPEEVGLFAAAFEVRRNLFGLRAAIGTSPRISSNGQRLRTTDSTFFFGRIALGVGARFYPFRAKKDGPFLEAISFAWVRTSCKIKSRTYSGRRTEGPCEAALPSELSPRVRKWGADWGLGFGVPLGILPLTPFLRYEHSVASVILQGTTGNHTRAIIGGIELTYVVPGSR